MSCKSPISGLRRAAFAWVPPIAWAAVLFFLSSLPGSSMPPGGFWQYDKLVHGTAYGVLGLLCYRALRLAPGLPRLPAALLAVLAAGLYGLSDEWHQSFVPGRTASGLDLLADVVGAALCVAMAARLGQRRQNSTRSRVNLR